MRIKGGVALVNGAIFDQRKTFVRSLSVTM